MLLFFEYLHTAPTTKVLINGAKQDCKMKTNLLATLVCFVIGAVFIMISKKIWVKLQDVRRRMRATSDKTSDNWADARVEDDLHFSFFFIRLLGQGSLIVGLVMLGKSLLSL